MLKSYFKLAVRNLQKRKTSTVINVLSLSAGLACCALVVLFYRHEAAFDKGFDNTGDIYRVTSSFSDGGKAPTTALPYSKYLKAEIPEIEDVSRLVAPGVTILQVQGTANNTPYSINNGYWVDPGFFSIFSFHFLQGNRTVAFNEPNTVVLSQKLAGKLFHNTYPIGKTIKAGSNIYKVTGIFKEDFLNHFKADFFASNNSDHIREHIASVTNWVIDPNYYAYIKLKHGSNLAHVLTEITAYTQRHAAADMKTSGDYMTNSLQPLLNIHLYSSQYQSFLESQQGNIKYLYILITIAVFILLLGCINYINLTTAQAIDRGREVGIRRVMGAGKASIRIQFMIETVIISLTALLLGGILAILFLPLFNKLTGQSLSFLTPESIGLAAWLILITLVTGILAGAYPAFYLASFKPVIVLKGKLSGAAATFSLGKVFIVMQFVIATCLIFATLVIRQQLHFMMNAKPGFDQDQQLVINLNSDQSRQNSAYFIQQLESNPAFKSVTGAGSALVSGDMNLFPAGKTVTDKHDIMLDLADENYITTLGLRLIAGHNFKPAVFTNKDMQQEMEINDIGKQVILNESAVKILGLDPYTAPGRQLSHLHNGVIYNYTIAGVVKDYHYFSLHAAVGPCAIMPVNPIRINTIIAKINGRQVRTALGYTQSVWKQLNPETPFSYDFLNKIFQYDYAQDELEQEMISTFAGIAIFISCLGLLGLITYSLAQKAKEIGIRKVIGASISDIVLLFSKQYFKLVIIANLIAWPVAWYFMNGWLNDFPYRVNISWWMFAVSLSACVLTGLITIAFKTIRAAMANPVQSLRAE